MSVPFWPRRCARTELSQTEIRRTEMEAYYHDTHKGHGDIFRSTGFATQLVHEGPHAVLKKVVSAREGVGAK